MNAVGLTPEKSQQLALGLDIAEADDDAADRNITPDEAQLISNAARDAFEDGAAPCGWLDEYRTLREDGWPWRVAAYIAWAASPRRVGEVERWPGTLQQLATDVLGLRTSRMIRKWRQKNPAIDEAVARLQVQPLVLHRGEIINALVASATDPSYRSHNDRKLALEMLGDYAPRQDVTLTQKAPDVTADEMAAAVKKAQAFEAEKPTALEESL